METDELVDDDSVSITVEASIDFLDDDLAARVEVDDVRLQDDGSLEVELVVVTQKGPTPASDGQRATTSEQSQREQSAEPDRSNDYTSNESDGEALDVPAYRNPGRLRDVYDEHETFSEMTDALGVDVTPQTVRRYAIKYGIHDPASNTSSKSVEKLLETDPDALPSADDDSAEPSASSDDYQTGEDASRGERPTESQRVDSTPAVAGRASSRRRNAARDNETGKLQFMDGGQLQTELEVETETGTAKANRTNDDFRPDEETTVEREPNLSHVGLRDGLTHDEVVDVVRDSKTLYEIQRQLDVERGEARELLQELNLIDSIEGRSVTGSLEQNTLDEIDRRIRSTTSL